MTDSQPAVFCPKCGKPLPTESLHGVCPSCLMEQAWVSRTMIHTDGSEPSIPPLSPEEIASKFPQFEILECLGRGGMGVVYKARQRSLNRTVAIKILAPEREHDRRFAERFAHEAELLARLNHPHIVTIHDFGEADGLFYLVMEYVDGVNLRDLLRDGKIEPKQALAIVPPICDALQYAHDKGIVHRDIKPENLLLDREGRVKIADFGIAGLVGAEGESAGTPPYMAPEQKDAPGEVDHRADIYALGVVLYEMLTGERPGKEVIAPSRKVQIDVRLDEIVLRALEKTPELRFQEAGILKTQLATLAAVGAPEIKPSATNKPESASSSAEWYSAKWFRFYEAFAASWGLLWLALVLIGNLGIAGVVGMSLLSALYALWRILPSTARYPRVGRFCERCLSGFGTVVLLTFVVAVCFMTSIHIGWPILMVIGIVSLGYAWWRDRCETGPSKTLPPPDSALAPAASVEGNSDVASLVAVPAIGLMVIAILNLVFTAFALLVAIYFFPHRPSGPAQGMQTPVWGMVLPLLGTILVGVPSFLLCIGASRMRQLRSYGLAITAAILGIITPPGLVIGVIFGIWALVVLSRREVRDAFEGRVAVAGATEKPKKRGCVVAAVCLAIVLSATLAVPIAIYALRAKAVRGVEDMTFTPEVRRQLFAIPSGEDRFIDFDSGRVLSMPPSLASHIGNEDAALMLKGETAPSQEYLDWIAKNGVDAVAMRNGLVLFNRSCSAGVGSSDSGWEGDLLHWNAIQARDVFKAADIIEREYDRVASLPKEVELPGHSTSYGVEGLKTAARSSSGSLTSWATNNRLHGVDDHGEMWIFKTRDGAKGVFVFDETKLMPGHDEKLIRYKLVRSGANAYRWTTPASDNAEDHDAADTIPSSPAGNGYAGLQRALLELPPRFVADIPMTQRAKLLRFLVDGPPDRYDAAHGYLHYYSDGQEVEATSMLYMKAFQRENGEVIILVHMPKPFAASTAPKSDQTFVFERRDDRWVDITMEVMPGDIDRTAHFRPVQTEPVVVIAPYGLNKRADGLGMYFDFGKPVCELVWDGSKFRKRDTTRTKLPGERD